MTGFENHAGFTITNNKLQLVEVNYKDEQFILGNVDEAYFNEPVDFENDKQLKITAQLQSAFNELQLRKPLQSGTVSFTLPLELFLVMQVPYDNTLLHQDLTEEFKWEFSILYPYIQTGGLVIQYIEVEKSSFIKDNSAIVIGLQRKYLQMLSIFCLQNNLKLKFVDNSHIASDRAIALSTGIPEGLALSIGFSNKHLSVIISHAGKPIYFSAAQLTSASEIPGFLNGLFEKNEFLNISRNSFEAAYFIGDEVSPSFVNSLSENIKINLNSFNPFEKIKPAKDIVENKYLINKSGSFSPAAGIAYRLA